MKRKVQNPKGITLVALVVTIVVLLILSGITITYVMGDNSIFKQAQKAKNETEDARKNEQEYLNNVGNTINNYVNESEKNNPPLVTQKIEKGEIVNKDKEEYRDENGNIAPIPGGFCVVKDIEGDKNTIERGLVISDVAEDDLDNSKHGNQFVWIPVPDYNKFHLIEGYSDNNLQAYLSKASNPSREAGDTTIAGSPGKPNAANSVKGTDESIAMYKSVKDNGGVYIARFEAGIAGTKSNSSLTTETVTDGTVRPLSQKGVGVWNSIVWGGAETDIASDGLVGNDNANGSVKVARSMYPASDTIHKVTSTLCYGVQWDAALNFIDSNYESGTAIGYVKDSTDMGNYVETPTITGRNISYEQKHIYDMAGNVKEWTMEAYSTDRRVNRGYAKGGSENLGSESPASVRYNGPPNNIGYRIGFRVTLYL